MYRHILIPTDGSKLAHKGVAHGLSLAKAVGARVTVLTVEPIFFTKKFADFKKEWSAQAASVLKGIADEANARPYKWLTGAPTKRYSQWPRTRAATLL